MSYFKLLFFKHFENQNLDGLGPYYNLKLAGRLKIAGWVFVLIALILFVAAPKLHGFFWGVAYFISGAFGLSLFQWSSVLGKAKQRAAQILQGRKSIILFLHTFETEGKLFGTQYNFESPLLSCFRGNVQFICLGNPVEKFSSLGIERIYLPKDTADWKPQVLEIMDKSELIVVAYTPTSGLEWEIDQLIKKGKLPQTVFYFPAIPKKGSGKHIVAFSNMVKKYQLTLPALKSQNFKETLIIQFDDSGHGLLSIPKGWYYRLIRVMRYKRSADLSVILYGKLKEWSERLECKPGRQIIFGFYFLLFARLFMLFVLSLFLLQIFRN